MAVPHFGLIGCAPVWSIKHPVSVEFHPLDEIRKSLTDA